MTTCQACKHLDLKAAAKIDARFPALGLGKCQRVKMGTATFITTTYARQCDSFDQAEPEIVAKRIAWDNKFAHSTGKPGALTT